MSERQLNRAHRPTRCCHCQVHGFPKVMGVLTHLDHFKDGKKLGNTKKRLKKRFWTDIYDGAKLFYLSGVINGKYPKTVPKAEEYVIPPAKGMIRRVTRAAETRRLLEDLRLPEDRVRGAMESDRYIDSRINRPMKTPEDVDVEVEILSEDLRWKCEI